MEDGAATALRKAGRLAYTLRPFAVESKGGTAAEPQRRRRRRRRRPAPPAGPGPADASRAGLTG